MADAFKQETYQRHEFDRPGRFDRIRLKRKARRQLQKENSERLDKDSDWSPLRHYFYP